MHELKGLVMAIFVALLLAVVGCSSQPATSVNPDATPETAIPESPEQTIAVPTSTSTGTGGPEAEPSPASETTEAQLDGRLVVALSTFGNGTFQPNLTPVSEIVLPFFDHMLQRDTETGALIPGVLSDWTMSADGKTWDIKLRPDIKFHNGRTMTIEDIKFSFEIGLRPEALEGAFIENLDNITVTGEDSIRIAFKDPWANWPADTLHRPGGGPSEVFPGEEFQLAESQSNWPQSWNEAPIGSGPYKFVRMSFDDFVEYEAFTDYWDGAPPFAELEMRNIPEDTTRKALLEAGNVDVVSISVLDISEMESKGINIISNPGTINTFFFFANSYLPDDPGWDPSLPWVADPNGPQDAWERARKVRQAFNLAIDRDTIHRVIYREIAENTPLPFMGTGVPGAETLADLEPYPYDPEEARRLLEEADFPMDRTVRIASFILSAAPEMPALAEAAATMWETNLGIQTELYPTEFRATVGPQQRDKTTAPFDIAIMRNSTRPTFIDNAKYFTVESWSYCYMLGDEFYQIYQDGASAVDTAVQHEKAEEMYRQAYDEYCVMPVAVTPALYGTSDKVESWELQPGHPWLHNYHKVIRAR